MMNFSLFYNHSRESSRTSRSSTSSFKENISDNIPTPSKVVAQISKPILKTIDQGNSRSPLSRRSNNNQSVPDIETPLHKIVAAEPNFMVKKENLENKGEKREELEFIKGKKCIKCGYSSVKVKILGVYQNTHKMFKSCYFRY